jgi:16S rRNA C1402 (ribose-2'-O) methylase RsmI
MNPSASLILIPTPISDDHQLDEKSIAIIKDLVEVQNYGILVEDLKVSRRQWLKWNLPREKIEDFILLNEHSETKSNIIDEMLKGKKFILRSDCGLPGMMDPGQHLINKMYDYHLVPTALSFPNSFILALSLSGFNHHQFIFQGMPPQEAGQRDSFFHRLFAEKRTQIFFDTPYRLGKLATELKNSMIRPGKNFSKRKILVAIDLNSSKETLLRGSLDEILPMIPNEKREWVMVLDEAK